MYPWLLERKIKLGLVSRMLFISCFALLLIVAQSAAEKCSSPNCSTSNPLKKSAPFDISGKSPRPSRRSQEHSDKKCSLQNCSTSKPQKNSAPSDIFRKSPHPSRRFQERLGLTKNSSTFCPKNFSCALRSCSDRLSFTDESTYTCYCDAYCHFFQDCCYDYWSACNASEHGKNASEVEADFLGAWFCVSLGNTSYWMKTKCSNSWPHDEVKSLCINPPSRLNSSTYLHFFPVSGANDNITYRNRHCARCNYQNNFKFWEFNMSLNVRPVGIRSFEDLIDFLLEFTNQHTMVNAVVPKPKMPRRYCLKSVSSCSYRFMSEIRQHDKCVTAGAAFVFGKRGTYRNKYCALCNGDHVVSCEPHVQKSSESPVQFPDFYLIINFRHQSKSSGYVVKTMCPEGVYDRHLKACVGPKDIVGPIDTVLEKYKIAIWFLSPCFFCKMPNVTHLQTCFTDVEPAHISNAQFQIVQKGIQMVTFDVQLTSTQSIQMLKNFSKAEMKHDSVTAYSYSVFKFIKPFTERFPLFLGWRIVRVIKTTSRMLGCVGLQVFNPSDYTKLEDGTLYVHKTKRNYTRDQYFKVSSSEGLIKVCQKQLPSDCTGFYVEYEEGEFEIGANLSLYHKVRGELYLFGEYTLEKDKVYICHIALREDNDTVRKYLTIIGLSLSIICSITVLITYVTFSQLRTLPGKNIINLTVGLLMLDLVWLTSPQAVRIGPLCKTTAFVIQYFVLFVHVSMVKIAYDTLSMFTDPIAHQRKCTASQVKSFMIVWSIPLVVVLSCCILRFFNVLEVQFTKSCWLSGKHVFAVVFIPVCLAVTFNIMCFTRSILKMRQLERNSRMMRAQKQEKNFLFVYLKLSAVFGLGWASAFFAVAFPVFSYLFVVLTAYQSVFIFLAFVCKKNVLLLYRNLFFQG